MGETKQVTLCIDGQYVQVKDGLPIIEATKKLNIFIPTLCYHESLKPYGSCRLCTVEVVQNRRTRLVTSCNYPATEGLEVFTKSIRVKEIRQTIMEVLLCRCPNVPAIQKLADQMGVKVSRFKKRENHRCMLCGLCVRVCEELVGVSALGFTNRGTEREVGTPFGAGSDTCIGCGSCSFICPTGCIEMIVKEGDLGHRYMEIGELSPGICPNEHKCESCEIDHQFLREMKLIVAKFRDKSL